MDLELLDVQAWFWGDRGNREQIVSIHWITEKTKEFQKNMYFCFIAYAKVLTVWLTTSCGKFLKKWEYQTTLLPPEKPVCGSRKNSQNQTWNNYCFKFGKGVRQVYILSFYLCNILCRVHHTKCQALVQMVKILLQCGKPGFKPWIGKIPGGGHGNPLQYSGLP